MIRIVFLLIAIIPVCGLTQEGCTGETDFILLNGEVEMNLRDVVGGPDYSINVRLHNDGSCEVTSVNMIAERIDEDGNVIEEALNLNLSSDYAPGASRSVGVNFDADTFGIIFGEPYRVRIIPNIADIDISNNEGVTIALDQILVAGMEDPFVPCPLPPPFCPPDEQFIVNL